MMTTLQDPVSKEFQVIETRKPEVRWSALPRVYQDRMNELDANPGPWFPNVADFDNKGRVTMARCWKCGNNLYEPVPLLRRIDIASGRHNAEPIYDQEGQPKSTLIARDLYREGTFTFRKGGVEKEFTYLHCADCAIVAADGLTLLAFCLGGQDDEDRAQPLIYKMPPNEKAQYMARFAGTELLDKKGPSRSPKDVEEQREKKTYKEKRKE